MKHQLEIQYKNEVKDFLKGMLIGDKNGLSDEVKDDFKESGLIHLLAVSGLHISLAGRRVYKLVPQVVWKFCSWFTGRNDRRSVLLYFNRWIGIVTSCSDDVGCLLPVRDIRRTL